MLDHPAEWQVEPILTPPDWFVQAVRQHTAGLPGDYASQLLWQRQIRQPDQLAGFLAPDLYSPSSPFEFGEDMHRAVNRLRQAYQHAEQVAIWGDFDADGITATAVLWEGLGQFFLPHQLTYYIPNRLTASHGLSMAGIDALAAQGYRLIVTCDTGSTNPQEIDYAQTLGIDVIVTDHHSLPSDRPNVVAILNPRYLPADHPLATLSGVAVAYKLIEALYLTLPEVPQRSLDTLLDLVAIGLIADLVELRGDCRYLAQRGIERLQQNQDPATSSRPGVAKLLELCKRSGDRPTDISFGLGPRINAISRIYGDARFAVELLTSQDPDRCRHLAEETELANTRRKALQKDVAQQVRARLAELDLSTTRVLVLSDPQWSIGVLGLVAGQIAQEYGRPTILLSTEDIKSELETDGSSSFSIPLARGSARSVNQIDLYQLVNEQTHLLSRFGGHPLAAGLSLPVENIAIFTEAINRQLRERQFATGTTVGRKIRVDLVVTVAELGKDLFRELRLLEPYGMGNPAPKLLLQNCWFANVRNQNIKDWKGRKVRYIKTEFEVHDDSTAAEFPGVWWEHYRDDLPSGRCDAIAEIDFNAYQKRYEIRLIAVRPTEPFRSVSISPSVTWIVDWRTNESSPVEPSDAEPSDSNVLCMTDCPHSWDELQRWFRRAAQEQRTLAIAYPPPASTSPVHTWQNLVGIAKYLSRTQKPATRDQLLEKLGIGDRTLQLGLTSLNALGFEATSFNQEICVEWHSAKEGSTEEGSTEESSRRTAQTIEPFLAAVQEEFFRRQYFYHVPIATLQAIAQQHQGERI